MNYSFKCRYFFRGDTLDFYLSFTFYFKLLWGPSDSKWISWFGWMTVLMGEERRERCLWSTVCEHPRPAGEVQMQGKARRWRQKPKCQILKATFSLIFSIINFDSVSFVHFLRCANSGPQESAKAFWGSVTGLGSPGSYWESGFAPKFFHHVPRISWAHLFSPLITELLNSLSFSPFCVTPWNCLWQKIVILFHREVQVFD